MNSPPALASVLVCHPGRQYSHELALALSQRNMLAKYLTGVPTGNHGIPLWQRRFFKSYIENYKLDLPAALVEHHFIAPMVRKITSKLFKRRRAVYWSHRADAFFDRRVSKLVSKYGAQMVVGYEHACEHIFGQAKKHGIVTVLDAASFHHVWQDRHYDFVESAKSHELINRKKDQEIALADFVVTVSEFARQSYLEAGVPEDRIAAIPLGADLNLFQPGKNVSENSGKPVRFLFIGHIGERKGADILLEAVSKLNSEGQVFSLGLAGKAESSIDFSEVANCKVLGWLPHHELSRCMQNYDVLILPSRHDSFGMVVVEAMACGLAGIVSDHVGAKELVQPKHNGDIVRAADANSLHASMLWFIQNSHQLPKIKANSIQTAQLYSWATYRERIVGCLEHFWRKATDTNCK